MIDTQAIRKKILDLALHGKLTEQLPEDGTAEEAFLRIQAEQIGESRKNKRLLPMSEDEAPFEIPNNWQWVRLGCVLDVISGVSYDKSDVTNKGLRIIRGGNIQASKIVLDESDVFLPEKYFDEQKMVRKEDIIIVASTGSSTAIGRAGFSVNDMPDTLIGAFLRICRPKSSVYAHYLHILFMSDYYNRHIRELSKGTNINNVKESYITNFAIPFPPGAEQHRIVEKVKSTFSILDTIDTLQSQYQDNLATLKSKIIDAGIQGKLTEQLPEDGTAEELYQQIQQEKRKVLVARGGREDKSIKPIEEDVPYILPSTWKWIRFGDIGLFKKGPFGSALTKSMFVPKSDTTIKVYEQQHAINKNINLGTYYITREYFDEKMRGFEVRPGDVIISCAGTIGETYILPDDIEQGIINQALMRVTIVPSIDKKFFQLFFDARLKRNAQSQSNGSAINNIPPFEVLKNWYFPLPPLAEQKRIVAKLEELLPLCEG